MPRKKSTKRTPRPHIGANHPATDAIDPLPGKNSLSIWFFCGALSLVYGLVLIPAGIYQWSHPPDTELAYLHPTFWWGILMTLFGAFYTVRFWPRR